jgi:cation:H+ antiporter
MCIGLTALFTRIGMPSYFDLGVGIILSACLVHLVFISLMGRLPRLVGLLCTAAYGYFVYRGVLPF